MRSATRGPGSRDGQGLWVPRAHHDLTQEQLAQHVGASRESVNKALSELAARGIILLEPKTVVILDMDRLRRKSS